jgi:tRNA-specific 2-thiouridylase
MDRIVVGFSGGVDSAVSAALLREQGYDVRCLYLETFGTSGAEEARAAAEAMGLPIAVADARAALEEAVCRPFADAYGRGETPNPCILCNPAVKFRFLTEHADTVGAPFIATGHYARAEGGALYKGTPENDQSYMLCRITRAQLGRLVLPLGTFRKTEVRAIAESLNLPAAHKPDSMEICFIPDGDHAAWIERRGEAPPPGDLIYNGAVVGRHGGIHRYTLGQRRGLGFAAGSRVYVSEIRPAANEVVLADGDGLFVSSLAARDMNWLKDPPAVPFSCSVRVRHSRACFPATAEMSGDGRIAVTFPEPVRAPTRGQSAVLYDGDRLLGGGFIE